MLLRYLGHTSGYSRQQLTRLVSRWQSNRLAPTPLVKRYMAPNAPFARKYTSADMYICHRHWLPHACGTGSGVIRAQAAMDD
ncbi:hypothetical protein [Verminephrobacter aporrectodeae]|uniref:hypothetical protein n=1 Tax=Verminephrobacter aporrectodeae TaxID=1110389 RepID=UPI0002378505|nr:hypothetical protein [Verminephrobacter aporrectodeae]